MRALIVEDEILASEELNYLIQEHSQIEVVDRLEDGLDVLKFLQEQEVDVIFLDINIPSLDGMMLAHHIGNLQRNPTLYLLRHIRNMQRKPLSWRRLIIF